MPDRMLTVAEVSRVTSLSRTTLYRMVERGQFPAPRRISAARVAWRESVVQAWLPVGNEAVEQGEPE